MIKVVLIGFVFFVVYGSLFSQEVDIVPYLKQIESGRADQAENALTKLQAENPDDPSVKFLDAVLTIDGSESSKKYEAIYTYHPKSKYADAALYRVFSYYYSLGFYKKAEELLNKLKSEYPRSPYIEAADRNIPDDEGLFALDQNEEEPVQENNNTEYKYTVQAGAFLNIKNAEDLESKLKDAGYFTDIYPKEVGGSILNVVTAGKLKNESEAGDLLKYLSKNFKLNGRVIPITH